MDNSVKIEILLNFLAFGLLLTALIWTLQRPSLRIFAKAAICTALLALITVAAYLLSKPPTLGEQDWYNQSPAKDLIFFAAMLFGMMSRYLTKAIDGRREKIEELRKQGGEFRKPGIEFDAWEFSYPFFVSAITYGLLMSQMEKDAITIPNLALSFQTGFFWQTLLAKQKG